MPEYTEKIPIEPVRSKSNNKGETMGRRKYTPEQEQELALTTVGENDDLPPDDFESEYDIEGEVEDLFDKFSDDSGPDFDDDSYSDGYDDGHDEDF